MLFFKRKKRGISTFQKSVTFSPQQHLSSPQKTFKARNWDKLVLRHEAIMLSILYPKSLADGHSCKILQMSGILQIAPWQPACSSEPSSAQLCLLPCTAFWSKPGTPFFSLFHFSPLGQDIVSNSI